MKSSGGEALLDRDPNRPYADWLIPKFSSIARGSRLTPERLDAMIFGPSLTQQEKDVLVEVLYNREEAIAFSFEEIGVIKPDVALQLLVPDVLDAFGIFKRHAGFQIVPRGGIIAVEHQTDMAILDVLTARV